MPSRLRNRYASETARWLSTLPKGIREEALENCDPSWGFFKKNATSLKEAIHYSFLWGDTPQGHNYWEKVQNNVTQGKYDAK